jgi:hypothetical protein
MKISAVILARFFAFIETFDLNPRGRVNFPQLVSALVERYAFAKFPQKLEEFDESKGVIFQLGRTKEFAIQQVQIFDHAIYVDTSSSTTDSENFFYEVLTWLSKDMGLTFNPDMVKRKTYVSQVTFFSDAMQKVYHPAVWKIAKKLSQRVPEFYGQPLEYHPSAFMLNYDPLTIKAGPANFSIDRRADTLFAENKFFSNAPLPTEEHIALLEELESDLLSSI